MQHLKSSIIAILLILKVFKILHKVLYKLLPIFYDNIFYFFHLFHSVPKMSLFVIFSNAQSMLFVQGTWLGIFLSQ